MRICEGKLLKIGKGKKKIAFGKDITTTMTMATHTTATNNDNNSPTIHNVYQQTEWDKNSC